MHTRIHVRDVSDGHVTNLVIVYCPACETVPKKIFLRNLNVHSINVDWNGVQSLALLARTE
jgi:hypothetical protein